MMAPSKGGGGLYGYVTDGLAVMLDGINKGSIPDAWTDLASGKVFTNHGAMRLADGWYFDGIDDYLVSDATEIRFDTGTLELVVKLDASETNPSIMVDDTNKGFGFTSVYGNHYIFSVGQKCNCPLSQPPLDFTSATISCYNGKFVLNGNNRETSMGSFITLRNTGKFWIGRSADGSRHAKGEICAIRQYSRYLTEEEIVSNQHIDNVRYNLGLSFPNEGD